MKVRVISLDGPVPILEWDEVPDDTMSFALFLVNDPKEEEDPTYYWVLYNISPDHRRLDRTTSTYTTLNSFRTPGYLQPQEGPVTLYFYALDNLYPSYDAYIYPPINSIIDYCNDHSLELVTVEL